MSWPGSFSPLGTKRWYWPRGINRTAQFDTASAPYEVVWHPRFLSTRWFVPWYSHWMARLHRARPFDVIHCHGTYPAGYVAARCKAVCGVPLIITSHGDDLAPRGIYDRKPHLRQRFRAALARADAAIAISDFTAGLLRRACPELRRIVDIPNGVDLRRFSTAAADRATWTRRSSRASISCSWAGSTPERASTCFSTRWRLPRGGPWTSS